MHEYASSKCVTFSEFLFNYPCCVNQIETRNNKLEMQSVNNKALIEELDKLLERLRVPSEVLCQSQSFSQLNNH